MYKFSLKARQDLKSIVKYTTAQFGIDQSDRYLADLKDVLSNLSQFPKMGRERNEIESGLLSYIHRSHTIYYRIEVEQIWIIRILHHRMDHKNWI